VVYFFVLMWQLEDLIYHKLTGLSNLIHLLTLKNIFIELVVQLEEQQKKEKLYYFYFKRRKDI